MFRSRLLVVVIVSAWLLAACGKSTPPSADPGKAAASKPAPSEAEPAPAKAFSVASVFPPGRGREMVLETCGSCHPVVCTALGQRTADRWENVKQSHKDKLDGRSSADLNMMFSYLKENFNDSKPEPRIPMEFLQQGCTPF